MNITKVDPDLLQLDLIGDDERGYDFLDDKEIVELKQIVPSNGVMNIYLDIRPDTLRTQPIRIRFKDAIKEIRAQQEHEWTHDQKKIFNAVVDDLTTRIENGDLEIKGKGIALFAAVSRVLSKGDKIDYDLFKIYHLPEAPVDLVAWENTLILTPLLVQKDEHPETGVVLFDREKVRFFLYSMGEAAEYNISLKNDYPIPLTKAHSWHGYGTHNHLQWQEQHYKQYLRQASIAITKIMNKAGWKWLVLTSPDAQEAKHLIDFLPKAIRQKFIGTASLPMYCSLNDVRDQVAPIVREAELNEEKQVIQSWTDEINRPNGLAVWGLADTVLAAQEYRLHTFIFPADFIQKGWRCQNCQSLIADLLAKPPSKCPYCNSDELFEMADIIGEIAIDTLLTGGEIEVVRDPEHKKLVEDNGIVGGLLRY